MYEKFSGNFRLDKLLSLSFIIIKENVTRAIAGLNKIIYPQLKY